MHALQPPLAAASLPMTEPPENLNFAEHLFATNRGRAGKIAYVDDRGALAYGDLEGRSRRFAAMGWSPRSSSSAACGWPPWAGAPASGSCSTCAA